MRALELVHELVHKKVHMLAHKLARMLALKTIETKKIKGNPSKTKNTHLEIAHVQRGDMYAEIEAAAFISK